MKTELEIIKRIQDGDKSAFRGIVEKYKKHIYYTALNMTGNHHEAEDISQEVFVKIFKHINSFQRKSKFSTWIYRITINTCIDRSKKKSSTSINYRDHDALDTEINLDRDSWTSFPVSPDRRAESDRINLNIEKALQKITNSERTVFVMRNYRDMPLKEIAEVLNISLGTVKSLLYRALNKLRKELAFYKDELLVENNK